MSKQRYPHLLATYYNSMKGLSSITASKEDKIKLLSLIEHFISSGSSNQAIAIRQSPVDNPHLKAIYQQRPDLETGWNANLQGFTDNIKKPLRNHETIELTENVWDLFISGFELATCQSPDSILGYNHALMSYVMDGRNSMIVKKDNKGSITARGVLRIVMDDNDKPALFIEKIYTNKASDKALLLNAVKEVAQQMNLSLYREGSIGSEKQVKLLPGCAPFEYFDSHCEGMGLYKTTQANKLR